MKPFLRSGALDRHSVFFQVREALEKEGCALCRLSLDAVARYLDSLAYESVNDPGLRDHLRSSRGFCPHHAWQFLGVSSGPFSVAMIYADALTEVKRVLELGGRQLRTTGNTGIGGLELATSLTPQLPCPACGVLVESQDRYLGTLVEHMPEPDFAATYRSSQGLCLPHLEWAMSETRDPGIQQTLVETALHTLVSDPPPGGGAFLPSAEFLSGADGSLMECSRRPTSRPRASQPEGQAFPERQRRMLDVEGCPLCQEARDSDGDPASLLPLANSGSLCNLHLRRVMNSGRSEDVSRLIERERLALVRRLLDDTDHSAKRQGSLRTLFQSVYRRLSPAPKPFDEVCCEADAREMQMQSGHAGGLAEAMINLDFRGAFLKSSGLCFTHLLLALPQASPKNASMLAELEAWKLQALAAELKEYIRKHDYRFTHEPWGDEASSPWRAVRKMAGAEGVWGVGGLWSQGKARP